MNLEFSGEVFVPGKSPKRIEDDHFERYRFAAGFVGGKIVLDIACGVGYGSRILGESGAVQVDGVDISREAIDLARSEYQAVNVHFRVGDICEYKTDVRYDVVTCFETIEHVEDYEAAFSNLESLLRPGGLLLVSSPNRPVTSPRCRTMDDKPVNAFHVREFTIDELRQALERYGFVTRRSDVYGQRQRRCFRNRHLRRLYRRLFDPDERASAVVKRVRRRIPRYFLIVATRPSEPASRRQHAAPGGRADG